MIKKETLRNRFEDNYTTITEPADNKKGYVIRYVYYAPWYIWQVSERDFLRKKKKLTVLELLGLLLFLMAVLFRSPLNRAPLIVFLTALTFCAQIMEFSGVVDLWLSKVKTTKIQYENIEKKFSFYPLARCVMLVLSAVAAVGMIAVDEVDEVDEINIWMISCFLICAVLAWQTRRIAYEIPVRIEDNDAMAKIVAREKQGAQQTQ